MEWTMRNGNKIEISDMDNHHLLNSIRMIRTNMVRVAMMPEYEEMLQEANRRKLIPDVEFYKLVSE